LRFKSLSHREREQEKGKGTHSFSRWEKVVKEKFMIKKSLDEGIKTGGKGNE